MTIRQIAEQTGVSTATVSRVLNTPEQVRWETRQRVLATVHATHYVSDGLASGLVSRRSRTIGLVIPTMVNSVYASSTQAIQRTAQAAGYTVLMGISDFSAAIEADMVNRLLERRVDGLILTGATRDPALYEKINRLGVPFITTWRLTRDSRVPSLSFDNYEAAGLAMRHLISLGHRGIGLICGRTDRNDRAWERRRAYEDALGAHRLPRYPGWVQEGDFEFADGQAGMNALIGHAPRPTAVFCANDIQAVGALTACRAHHVAVPDRMSVMGFDDLPIAQCTLPPLSTIRVPAAEMGTRATEILIAAIKSDSRPGSGELPTALVRRASTARPPGPPAGAAAHRPATARPAR